MPQPRPPTSGYLDSHPAATAAGGAALTHGFHTAFYVLAAIAAVGAVLSALMIESKPAIADADAGSEQDEVVLEAA
jgi:hypothetical protein